MLTLLKKICLMFSLFLSLLVPSYADNWRLDKENNGIKVYTRTMQGSAVREIKSEVLIDASLDSILAVFNDISQYPRWYDKNTKATVLATVSVMERYHYQNFTMPFPVTNRDIIIHSQITQSGNNIKITSRSAHAFCDQKKLKSCNVIKKSKNIRITRLQGEHLFTPQKEGGVKLVWRQHVEPAGNIPKWLINAMSIEIPYNTLQNLLKRVKLKQYRDIKLKRDNNGQILGF